MAAGDLRLYDPDQVVVTVAGKPLSGFADGEFCRIAFEANAFDDKVGTDGEVTRTKTNDRRATVTIRLMQTSPANLLLSALLELDRSTPNGAGVGPFYLEDKSGSTIYLAEKCWISKGPDSSWDREATEREWVIRCAALFPTEGGN